MSIKNKSPIQRQYTSASLMPCLSHGHLVNCCCKQNLDEIGFWQFSTSIHYRDQFVQYLEQYTNLQCHTLLQTLFQTCYVLVSGAVHPKCQNRVPGKECQNKCGIKLSPSHPYYNASALKDEENNFFKNNDNVMG